MNDPSHQLRRRVAALCPAWDPAGLSGFIYLDGGYSNDNYRFSYRNERYVLRAPFRHRGETDRHLERRFYEAAGGVGTPELIALDPDSGDMISRWVPGRLLADTKVDGAALVDYLLRLHRRLPEVERAYDPLVQARADLQRARPPRWVARLAERLVWEPETPRTCHNDLNPWNVILTPDGEWVTLDWEWAGRSDPLFDLVTLHQGAALPDAELTSMAVHYLDADAPAARLEHCLTVFWLRETAWAMAELASGHERAEVAEQRRMGLERLTALARR